MEKRYVAVLRSSPADLVNQVMLDGDDLHPRPVRPRRTGRPKADWVSTTNVRGAPATSINNPGQLRELKNRAVARLPFTF